MVNGRSGTDNAATERYRHPGNRPPLFVVLYVNNWFAAMREYSLPETVRDIAGLLTSLAFVAFDGSLAMKTVESRFHRVKTHWSVPRGHENCYENVSRKAIYGFSATLAYSCQTYSRSFAGCLLVDSISHGVLCGKSGQLRTRGQSVARLLRSTYFRWPMPATILNAALGVCSAT